VAAYYIWRRPLQAVFPFALAVVFAAARLTLLSSKEAALTLIVGLLIGYGTLHYPRGLRASTKGLIGTAVSGAAFVGALLVFAGAGTQPTSAEPVTDRVITGAGLLASRSYGTDSLISVNHYLTRSGALWGGSSISELAISWVPRQFWPDKPKSFSQRIAVSVFYYRPDAERVFVSPTIGGEGILNFGLLGLPLFWLLFGFVVAAADSRVRMPMAIVWILVLTHTVEGALVAQFWLGVPLILGGRAALFSSKERPAHALAAGAAALAAEA